MAVEVYQGTIQANNVTTFQQAIKEIFSMAGYSVTPDATSQIVTVDNGGNIFGHGTFALGNIGSQLNNTRTTKFVMIVDKDQHVLIVSTDVSVNDTYTTGWSGSQYSIACLLCGDVDDGGDYQTVYMNRFNIPYLTFSRVGNQPCIVTPCIDMHRNNLAPIFIVANGVVYPLGTYVTDGSTKFVSNGNGLLIKVKEQ